MLQFVMPKFLQRFMKRLEVDIDIKLQVALNIIHKFSMEMISSLEEVIYKCWYGDRFLMEETMYKC